MPVRTRSQRAKQARMETSTLHEGEENTDQNTHSHSNNRKSVRFSNKEQSFPNQAYDQKSEEHSPQIAQGEASPSMLAYTTPNSDEIRQYVQNMLNSPQKVSSNNDSQQVNVMTTPPRVSRITLENDDMEFLIPPKQSETPFEIRQRIRRVLSPDSQPKMAFLSQLQQPETDDSRASAVAPVFDPNTGLWSPNTPNYDDKKAERVSRFLFVFIFTVLFAVFAAVFHEEIMRFLQKNVAPFGPQLKQYSETMWTSLNVQFEWLKHAITTCIKELVQLLQQASSAAESAVIDDEGIAAQNIHEHDAVTK